MKLVYVAGPFRGKTPWEVEENVRRAERLSLKVWQKGIAVLCPHTNTRYFDGAAPDFIFLEGTLEMLKRCDAVLLAECWASSKGTRAEVASALDLGIPVFTELSQLDPWQDGDPVESLTFQQFQSIIEMYEQHARANT